MTHRDIDGVPGHAAEEDGRAERSHDNTSEGGAYREQDYGGEPTHPPSLPDTDDNGRGQGRAAEEDDRAAGNHDSTIHGDEYREQDYGGEPTHPPT